MLTPTIIPYAGLLGLGYIALSVHVIRQRVVAKQSLGFGKGETLLCATRAHANFSEYVPITLILLWLLEQAGIHCIAIAVMAAVFGIGRVSHAYGMLVGEPEHGRMFFRQFGMMITFGVIGISSVLLLGYWIWQ